MRKVPLDKLEPNWWNPCTVTEEKYEKLRESILKTNGKYIKDNPLLVRETENGFYQIVDGEKRWKVLKELPNPPEKVWVIVRDLTEEEARARTAAINSNRGTLNYFLLSKDLCEQYYKTSWKDGEKGGELLFERDEEGKLKKSGDYDQNDLEDRYGFSGISYILPIYPRLKKLCGITTFTPTQFQELARVKNDKLRELLVERVKERDWDRSTIRKKATAFNNLIDYLDGHTSSEDLKKNVLERLLSLGDSLLEYSASSLKNKAKNIIEEEKKKRVIHGDMFEELPDLDTKFDCIVTDPPYGVSWEREYELEGRKDISQDKGEWDHFTWGKYLQFTREWIEVVKPKLEDGGALIVFTSDVFLSYIIRLLRVNGFRDRKTIVWKKKNPQPSVEQDNFVSSVEYILYATKGSPNTFNWQGQNKSHNLITTKIAKEPVHPTQKPVPLLKKILEFVTNPGDWVLDPFAGSGSTAVACEELNRNWTMIEKEEEFVNTIERRISEKDKKEEKSD